MKTKYEELYDHFRSNVTIGPGLTGQLAWFIEDSLHEALCKEFDVVGFTTINIGSVMVLPESTLDNLGQRKATDEEIRAIAGDVWRERVMAQTRRWVKDSPPVSKGLRCHIGLHDWTHAIPKKGRDTIFRTCCREGCGRTEMFSTWTAAWVPVSLVNVVGEVITAYENPTKSKEIR